MKPLQQYVQLVRSGPSGLFSRGDLDRLAAHADDGAAGAATLRELGATSFVDVGSGGGVPGLPLAIELDGATAHLVESQGWKAEFLLSCARELGIADRVAVHAARAEEAVAVVGRESVDAGTARAVAEPLVVAEYLAPYVRVGGHLVLWSTREQVARPVDAAAQQLLGLGDAWVVDHASELRSTGVLLVWPKLAPCTERVPRRIGVAARRPLR